MQNHYTNLSQPWISMVRTRNTYVQNSFEPQNEVRGKKLGKPCVKSFNTWCAEQYLNQVYDQIKGVDYGKVEQAYG